MSQGNNCTAAIVNRDTVGGFGTQAAFLANATITVITVLLGYLCGALNDEQHTFLDRRIINWFQTKYTILKKRVKRANVEDLARRLSCTTRQDIDELWQTRKEAIARFILAVSDTQLVTGLAILIAGLVNPGRVTIYDLHIILSQVRNLAYKPLLRHYDAYEHTAETMDGLYANIWQAWLSSTTHLATLDALRNHLRGYGIIRDIRVACMLNMLLLLTITFSFIQTDWHWNDRVYVMYQGEPFLPWKAVTMIVGNTAWVCVLFIIWGNYFTRIQDLYVNQRHTLYLGSSLEWRLRSHRKGQPLSHSQHFAELISTSRRRRIFKIPETRPPLRTLLKAIHAYEGSFLSSIPGIFFCFSYGVTWNIEISNLLYKADLKICPQPHADRMGFGEVMPLLLLLLPILAAGATYYDYRIKLRDIEKRQQSRQLSMQRSNSSSFLDDPFTQQVTFDRDIYDQLLVVEQRYEQSVAWIQKYFYADDRALKEDLAKGMINRKEHLVRKQKILAKYAQVEDFEKNMGIAPAVCLFFLQILVMSPLAVLMNVGWMKKSERMLIGAYVFLGALASGLIWFVYEAYDFVQTRRYMGRRH